MKGFALNKQLKTYILALLALSCLAGAGAILSREGGASEPLRETGDSFMALRGVVLTDSQSTALSRPIGVLSGRWSGIHNGIAVSVELDSKIPTINFNSKTDIPSASVAAEFSRKGRLLTVGQVTCVKPVTRRVQSLAHTGCPLISEGDVFVISMVGERLMLKGNDSEIALNRE